MYPNKQNKTECSGIKSGLSNMIDAEAEQSMSSVNEIINALPWHDRAVEHGSAVRPDTYMQEQAQARAATDRIRANRSRFHGDIIVGS